MIEIKSAHRPGKAAAILISATGFWGASFLFTKALGQHQHSLVPNLGTWFQASACSFSRFAAAALLVAIWRGRNVLKFSTNEFAQGIGLGVFGGLGMLFQTDGVMHTAASTSAFLTQCYCIFIPVWVAFRKKALPGLPLTIACFLVMAGVGILANIQWGSFQLGRGEWETIISSLFFTGQILWLQRPIYAKNNTMPVSLIMFAVVALLSLPVVMATGGAHAFVLAFSTAPALVLIGALTIFCTVIAYILMNHWQPHLPATHAALIYCCEPVCTSLFALFLPACLSRLAHINYANETLGWRLLAGGGLITAANVLVLWLENPAAKTDPLLAPDANADADSPGN
jgi:drug/metabolite transporter (DMT)-like permease